MAHKILSGKNILVIGLLFATLMNVTLFFNLVTPDTSELLNKDDNNNNHDIVHNNNEMVTDDVIATSSITTVGNDGFDLKSKEKSMKKKLINAKHEIKSVVDNMMHLTSKYQRNHERHKNDFSHNKKLRYKQKKNHHETGEWGLSGSIKTSDDDLVLNSDGSSYRLPNSFYPRARNAKFRTKDHVINYEEKLIGNIDSSVDRTIDEQEGERIVYFLHMHKSLYYHTPSY